MSQERLLPAPPKFEGYSYLFGGVPWDLQVMAWSCWEERVRRLQAVVSLGPTHGLCSQWWDLPQVMEKRGAWCPCQDQSQLVRSAALVTSDTSAAINLQKGNNLKLGKQENSFQKAWKLACFMLRITPLPQYPEWIMPNFPCTHTKSPFGLLNNSEKFQKKQLLKRGNLKQKCPLEQNYKVCIIMLWYLEWQLFSLLWNVFLLYQ